MHDWWLGLTASAFGKLIYCEQATVRYRQHDANTIGASRHVPAKLTRLTHWRRLLTAGPNRHLLEVGPSGGGLFWNNMAAASITNNAGTSGYVRCSACGRDSCSESFSG